MKARGGVVAAILLAVALATAGRGVAAPASSASVGALIAANRFAAAESLARLRLGDLERRFGEASLPVARMLDSLVAASYERGGFQEEATRSAIARAIRIKTDRLGATHLETAASVHQAATLRYSAGEYAAAESLYRVSLDARRRGRAPDADLGETWLMLGRSLERVGRLDEADTAIVRGGDLLRGPGGEPRQIGQVLVVESALREAQGRYDEARRVLAEGFPEAERVLGPDHPDLPALVDRLATLEQRLGKYAEARAHFEQALGMMRRLHGPDNVKVATEINNLAVLLGDMRLPDEERTLLLESLRIYRSRLGDDNLYVARTLNTLGTAYVELDSLPEARAVYERSLELKRAKLGEDAPSTLLTKANMAILVERLGEYERAATLHDQVLAARERALGTDHPDVAVSAWRLGAVRARQGRWTEARPTLLRALARLEARLGPVHPFVQRARYTWAEDLAALGEPAALAEALASEQAWREHIRHTVGVLPEAEAARAAIRDYPGLSTALSLAAHPGGLPADSLARVLDAIVRSRALELDELMGRHRARIAAGEDARSEAERFVEARGRVAAWLARGGTRAGFADTLARLASAERDAERALLARSARFRGTVARERAGWDDVRRSLPPGSALISYVVFTPSTWAEPDSARRARGALVAFVTRPDAPPVAIPLGPASRLDSLVAAWRERAGHRPAPDERPEALARAGERLRRFVWDPVASRLDGVEDAYVVPDGSLHLVALGALPGPRGRYLVEQSPTVRLLTAERDLVPGDSIRPALRLLAVGNPDFDATTTSVMDAAAHRGPGPGCAAFGALVWRPLPETAGEIDDVMASWREAAGDARGETVTRLAGPTADEASFKRFAPRASWIHVATHGFFLDADCDAVEPRTRGVGGIVREGATAPSRARRVDPLRLSGLVLAGANRRLDVPGAEDGILTAEEVATLDLSAAAGVVLSACETGLGDVRGDRGVAGLRRAFQIAGARTLVLSLWAVRDRETREWMDAFYRARRGFDAADAARAASVETLRRRRQAGLSTHPFFWAAFVTSGADR